MAHVREIAGGAGRFDKLIALPMGLLGLELFSNGASAAWSREAAELAPFVNNSKPGALGRLCFWTHRCGAGTARPTTTVDKPTLDVCPETVGWDESAAQFNESSDASKLNGSSISPSPLVRRRVRSTHEK
jgi:hypothetical protein